MRHIPQAKFNLGLFLIFFLAFVILALPTVRGSGTLRSWLTHAASNESNPGAAARQHQRQRGQPCPTCAPPSPRRIYAPAIELREAERCEIVLNSRSPNPIEITPTFYAANGDAVVGTPVQLQPAEIRFVPIGQLLPSTLRGQRKWGGIALAYIGGVLEVWAQITFHGIGGGSIDETFNILEEPGSEIREAVWWMPKRSSAIIALGNSSDTAIHTTAQFAAGDAEEIDIPPFATKFIRRHAQSDEAESVKLSNAGPDGSLRVAGFVTGDDENFASGIRFYDTKRTVQSNLYATNLRLENTNPRMFLKNTSGAELSVRPRFFSSAGEQGNPVELPSLTLRPQEILDVDLNGLREAASTRSDLASVSAEVLNNGAPGSVIGALYSTSQTTQLTADVPLRDSGKMRNSTGSYPWRVDGDYTTIVNITNITNQPASFIVDIRYPGGHYFLPARELPVGGTATFDLRQLISEQKPDNKGNVIPLSMKGGQFHWSVFGGAASSKLIGRSEVVSISQRVSSSYSCPSCCPDSGPFGYLTSPGSVPVGGFANVETQGWMTDCNGYTTDTTLYIYPWWTENASIASVNSSGRVHGLSAGETYVNGSWTSYFWNPGPEDCSRDTEEEIGSAPLIVQPTIVGLNDTWYFNGLTPAFYTTTETLNATSTGAGSYEWSIVQGSDHARFTGGVSTIVTSTNTVDLIPTGKSTSARDVGVRVKVNGVTSPTFGITIHALDRLVAGVLQDISSGERGYESHINYAAKDQFGSAPPYDIEINENFPSSAINDYAGTTWVGGPAGSTTLGAGQGLFYDMLAAPLISSLPTPVPVPPQSPLSGTKIIHIDQQWRIGSSTSGVGYPAQFDSIQLYLDHGRHFNIVSPVP